jgi:hypothetical protein
MTVPFFSSSCTVSWASFCRKLWKEEERRRRVRWGKKGSRGGLSSASRLYFTRGAPPS